MYNPNSIVILHKVDALPHRLLASVINGNGCFVVLPSLLPFTPQTHNNYCRYFLSRATFFLNKHLAWITTQLLCPKKSVKVIGGH